MRTLRFLSWPLMVLALTCLGFGPCAAHAQSGEANITLRWQLNGPSTEVTAQRIGTNPATWWVQGLPYPGTVLWQPATQTLAYQHPTELSWLGLTPADMPLLASQTPSFTLIPAAKGQPWQGTPTRRWAVMAGPEACGALFTARSLGNGWGATDLHNLISILDWLNTGKTPQGCATPWPTQPPMGLPTHWAGPWGLFKLVGVEPSAPVLEAPAWPANLYPADAETRLRLLLAQLPLPERMQFLQANANQPLLTQIEMLATQLAAQMPAE